MDLEQLASKFFVLADAKDESSKSLPRLPEDSPTMKSLETETPPPPSFSFEPFSSSMRPPTMPYTGGEESMTASEIMGLPPQRHEQLFVEVKHLRELIAMLLGDPEAKHYTINQLKAAVDAALYG